MKTAQDVIEEIDTAIVTLEHDAASVCMDTLIERVDRETYREAMGQAIAVKAIKRLREELVAKLNASKTSRKGKR